MQFGAHPAAQRFVDHLVLPDPGHAGERGADDSGGIMVAVAGEVADLDLGVGDGGANQILDLACRHRHQLLASMIWRRASTVLWPSASRIFASSQSTPAAVRSPR